ncbi:Patatin-like phospholipase domain protein [Quillaja saponaria]|nr:Patatin-like phospholipase domain protein [Quillaja saponaria]
MEMIQDMPESCFELSLKDMVDGQEAVLEAPEEIIIDETSLHNITKVQFEKKIKKIKSKSNKPRQMLRVESFESETFLLKMFFPTSLASKKKAKVGKCSTEQLDKDRWIKRFFLAGEKRNNLGSSISESSSGSSCNNTRSSNVTRYADCHFSPGCWTFFHTMKSRIQQRRGCIF